MSDVLSPFPLLTAFFAASLVLGVLTALSGPRAAD